MNSTFSDSPAFPPQNHIHFLTVTNLASGGAIGTALASVDKYQGACVTQTTASQTITLPSPTGDAPKFFILANTGSVAFTFNQKTIYPGTCVTCFYSGIAVANMGKVWMVVGASATLTTTTSTTV